jgi:hypothetical protein
MFDKYYINVSYVPARVNGQQLVNIGGVTQSMPTYSGEYWVASMPEIRLTATGSSQTDAFTNLLVVATGSNPGTEPLSNVRTW